MPHYPNRANIKDPDLIQLPMTGISFDGKVHDMGWHSHEKAQLIYAIEGCFQLEIDSRLFYVPPTRAVWIPSRIQHFARSLEPVKYRSLYIDSQYFTGLYTDIQVIHVNVLLKALIEKACEFAVTYEINGPEARLAQVLIDEVLSAKLESYSLPLPEDKRLRKVLSYVEANLDACIASEHIAAHFGLSARTLTRLCKKAFGMSFEQWRAQLKLLKAIELVSLGHTTTQVAQALGYSNDSAFIHMFKKALGVTPGQYKP